MLAGPRHVARTPHATRTTGSQIAVAPPPSPPSSAGAPATSCTEASTAAAAWPASTALLTPTPFAAATKAPESPPASPAAASTTATPAPAGSPALAYAALDNASCEAQLKKRSIPYTSAGASAGVDLGIRLAGKLHGVDVHGVEPAAKRPTSQWEILDCRLALALDDFTVVLAQHDVVEAIHMSMYRPPAKNTKAKTFARHEAALAIDLGSLIRKDGSKLVVLEHWHGGVGTKTCGPDAKPSPATKEALELRSILCEAADAHLFNVVLTPNYNKPHANHFHLEVTRGVKWFLVH